MIMSFTEREIFAYSSSISFRKKYMDWFCAEWGDMAFNSGSFRQIHNTIFPLLVWWKFTCVENLYYSRSSSYRYWAANLFVMKCNWIHMSIVHTFLWGTFSGITFHNICAHSFSDISGERWYSADFVSQKLSKARFETIANLWGTYC